MRYITAEQFKEQPGEIQKALMDWWKPTIGDLVCSEKYGMATITENMTMKLLDPCVMEVLFTRNIPLFTLQQLWEFIEDKGYQAGTNNFIQKEKYIVRLFKSMMQFEPSIEIHDKDKLQAFWKCACEVARAIK